MDIVNTTITTTGEGTATITATNADFNGVIGDFAGDAVLEAVEFDATGITADGDITVTSAEYIVNTNLISVNGGVTIESVKQIVDSVILAKSGEEGKGNVEITATGEIDGTTITAGNDLTVSAAYLAGDVLVSENGNINATAENAIDATSMLAKAGAIDAAAPGRDEHAGQGRCHRRRGSRHHGQQLLHSG